MLHYDQVGLSPVMHSWFSIKIQLIESTMTTDGKKEKPWGYVAEKNP